MCPDAKLLAGMFITIIINLRTEAEIREQKQRSDSKAQIVVHGNDDLLVGAQIALGGLNRRVTEQELDLLQIATALPAQLGAGTTQVMGTEVLDPDLLR
jgi:hypothetical protein